MLDTMTRRALAALILAASVCAACDDVTEAVDAGPDRAAFDAGAIDSGPDAAPMVDGGLDAAADQAVDAASDAEVAPDAAPDPRTRPCPSMPSAREPGSLHVDGCRMVRDGEGAVIPRVVVVSRDSLDRAAATPLHEEPMYGDLARAGVEVVWLLVLWDGIEPMPGTYNGAYLGRICQQARWAGAAGLDVVLSMHQQRFGPALGGHGMPRWATPSGRAPVPEDAGPDHPSLIAAWSAFWTADDRRAELLAAWIRLLDTCAEDVAHGIDGIHAISDPIFDGTDAIEDAFGELTGAVHDAAEARLGPLLRFESALHGPSGPRWLAPHAPDTVRVMPGWGPARWPGAQAADPGWQLNGRDAAIGDGVPFWLIGVGGPTPDAMNAALDRVESAGLVAAVWQDGFGSPSGLRDMDGRPAALWDPALDRPRPARIAGRPLGWQVGPDTITLTWFADGTEQGLSRFDMAGRPVGPTQLNSPEGDDWFTDYDPATDLLAIFVDGPPRIVELTISLAEEAP